MQIPDKAFWIGSDHAFDLQEAYLNFRRDIALDHVPHRARLAITADSRYRLWVNGAYVCRGPARCWPHAQQLDEIDITPFLKPGENAIAVQVYCPGYSHFAHVHRGAAGLLAWLNVDGETDAVTDQNWKVQRDRSWDPLVQRVSIYGSGVERRNLNLDREWQTEAPTGESWKIPRIVSPPNAPLWSGLRPRDVPMLVEERIALEAPWQFRRGAIPLDHVDPHQALRAAFAATQAAAAPDPSVGLSAGEIAVWIFDLGSSRVGLGCVEIDGALGGERLLVSYAEKLRDGELVLSDPDTYCRMRLTDEFTLRQGRQRAESFSQRGGRYLIFALHAPEAVTLKLQFFAQLTAYPLAEKPLVFTNPALANIAALCRTTVLNCLQDGFVDSVWRESSQWLGDCVTEAFALAAISNDARPLRRAIVMAAEGAYADGILPSVLPGEVHAYTITDYNFSWIELLKMYLDHPGADDAESLLAGMMPVMDRMLARFRTDLDGDGLLMSQPGRRLFLDWSGVDRQEPNLTYNGRYLHGLQIAAQLASECGNKTLAARCKSEALSLSAALLRAFLTPEGWRENRHGTPASQLGLSLLVLTGVIEGDAAQAAADAIIARSLDLDDAAASGELVLASPFMHHYVFLALERLGLTDAILAIIHARWGRWAETGEMTTWENWNTDFPDGSRCHGFSAHPLGWLGKLSRQPAVKVPK